MPQTYFQLHFFPLQKCRNPPGLRPSHLAALNALAQLSGAPLHNAVGDARVSWTPADKEVQWGTVEVDAGTGGRGWWGVIIVGRTPQDTPRYYIECLDIVLPELSNHDWCNDFFPRVNGQIIPYSLRSELNSYTWLHSLSYLQFGQALASFRYTKTSERLSAGRCWNPCLFERMNLRLTLHTYISRLVILAWRSETIPHPIRRWLDHADAPSTASIDVSHIWQKRLVGHSRARVKMIRILRPLLFHSSWFLHTVWYLWFTISAALILKV